MSGTGYDNGGVVGAAGYGQQQGAVYGNHQGAVYGQQQAATYSAGGYGQPHHGGYGQQAAYGGQQYQADTTGVAQQDYSAEWAAYYAAQAAAGAAVTTATVTTPAPAPSSEQQAADAYNEQFHRYAYYYGEPAARQYYGAWSPPVGTPNPYGTNPSGITAPPEVTTVEPVIAAAAPSSVAVSANVRDTGRRGVSNLPAWMTNGN